MKQITRSNALFATLISILSATASVSLLPGCKKPDETDKTDNIIAATKIFPSANEGAYWKLYYDNSRILTDTSEIQYVIDSVYVSADTVGLNIIDINDMITDTARKIFSILKCNRIAKKNGQTNWTSGTGNYGVFRIDSINKKIHSIRTVCNCWPSNPQYPTEFFFYETTVFDYNVKTGDTAWIEHYYDTHETTATIEDFYFNGYLMKKQFFQTDGLSFGRTQLAGIFNTIPFAMVAVPGIIREPPAMLKKIVYYDNSSDSLVLSPDSRFY